MIEARLATEADAKALAELYAAWVKDHALSAGCAVEAFGPTETDWATPTTLNFVPMPARGPGFFSDLLHDHWCGLCYEDGRLDNAIIVNPKTGEGIMWMWTRESKRLAEALRAVATEAAKAGVKELWGTAPRERDVSLPVGVANVHRAETVDEDKRPITRVWAKVSEVAARGTS